MDSHPVMPLGCEVSHRTHHLPPRLLFPTLPDTTVPPRPRPRLPLKRCNNAAKNPPSFLASSTLIRCLSLSVYAANASKSSQISTCFNVRLASIRSMMFHSSAGRDTDLTTEFLETLELFFGSEGSCAILRLRLREVV